MDGPTPQPPEFTIVGAGLAGALLACYLGRAGRRVDVYEKRYDPRGHDPEGGRSINLALSVRGLHALGEVNLADAVLRQAIPMRGRMIHSPTGHLAFQPYGKDDAESIHSVSRAGLNLALVSEAARHEGVRLAFRRRCTGVDLHTGAVELADEATGGVEQVPARVVIGADGAYSAVRGVMQKRERFDYSQDYLGHGYKELTIPPGPGGFQMEPHALHIWPRHSFMMIALPNVDGSFTCTLFLPYEGEHSFAALQTEAALVEFFREQFPDALRLLPSLTQEIAKNPTGGLVTVRCAPWHAGDKVVLLGDACHAVVPFLGQGMNAAFEDCSVLSAALALFAPDATEDAFRYYESRRKPNTDTLADLCIDNFIEMRDRVSSPLFRLKKRLQVLLHKLFPRWYLPLYTLVTFTRTPYADALRRAKRQDTVVRLVLAAVGLVLLAVVLLLFFN
jgi:kynurenine 3-monooxygenase